MDSRGTIFIIDQEKILVDLLTHELASDHIRICTAPSATEARLIFGQIHVDLVILDPDISLSLELLSFIRSAEQQIPVIALTHARELNDKLTALGIQAVVDRSQGLRPLLTAVRSFVDWHEYPTEEKATVLVVDDEEEILDMFSCALDQWGYAVITAKDGGEALQAIERTPRPALVLLDLRMPGKGGMEVLKEIRAKHPTTAVIMVTAISDRELAHHAIQLGAFDYVVKPLDLPALESLIIACLSDTEYRNRPWWKRLIS